MSGVQDALKQRLFRAYFTEGASIGDTATLVCLDEEVGLDGPKCAQILWDGTYGTEVRGDIPRHGASVYPASRFS
jgi:predicted DsbA family dithiol-disulfide isomerase